MRRAGKNLLVLDKTHAMRVEARIYASAEIEVEPEAAVQLANAASLPGVVKAAAMPDIHVGYGVPIGAVVAMEDAVIPAAVGYDINCGMRLLTTPLSADEIPLAAIAREIHGSIPLGEGKHNVSFAGEDLRRLLSRGIEGFIEVASERRFEREYPMLADGLDLDIERGIAERVEDRGSMEGSPIDMPVRAAERGKDQFGTLGGGNHFVEIQRVSDVYDETLAAAWGVRAGQAVVMMHTGSRGLGHETGGHFMKAAAEYDRIHGLEHPNRDLAWLPMESREARAFMGAMRAAANFAFVNRHVMSILIRRAIRNITGAAAHTVYDVTHNMAKIETHGGRSLVVHRKGATRAFTAERMRGTPFEHTGQPVLIPGSMGTASYLLVGEPGNGETLCSVNHGAGRVLSRTAAAGKRHGRKAGKGGAIGEVEFERSMEGILLLADSRRGAREEAPAAYKDIDAVIETIVSAGFARKVARMRPLAVLKG